MIGQFLLYNLLPSILIGLLAWLFVLLAFKLLPIEDPLLRLGFLSVPVIKSTLVLLGWDTMLPWPGTSFAQLQAQALPLSQFWPYLLVWAGLLLLLYFAFVKGLRHRLLARAQPVSDPSHRLVASLRRVRGVLADRPVRTCATPLCVVNPLPPDVTLQTTAAIDSPLAMTAGGQPIILWPQQLTDRLTDAELDAVMAHELGHFMLRRRHWCSTTLLRRLTVISPAAALVGAQLDWEEELASDDIGLHVVADPTLLANALLKSFRFAQEKSNFSRQPGTIPALLGRRPLLSRRIERMLNRQDSAPPSSWQYLSACLLSIATIFIFFSAS